MAKKASARRYAQAVFQIAFEKRDLAKWQSDLRQLAVLNEDPAVADLLENPRLRFDDKVKVLNGVLKDVGPFAMNLVYLLAQRNSLKILGEIAAEFEHLADDSRGIQRAGVVTAVPLDADDRRKLETNLSAVVGKTVVVTPEVDPAVLGGVVARVGGKLLDASVRSRLAALKNEIGSAVR